MRRIDQLLEEYGGSHQNRTNKLIHWVCVPIIFFSIGGLLWSIPFPLGTSWALNWATLVIAALTVYYMRLSLPIGVGMLTAMILCAIWAHWVDTRSRLPLWGLSLGMFVIAWMFQFYGHKKEGKKPSFLKDIQFLLVGPAWILRSVYKRLGIPY